jgi:hypothetical protein
MVGDNEIDRLARHLLAQHGSRAALEAAEKLNEYIDSGDYYRRDTWARIVHRIHEIVSAETSERISSK